MAASSIDLSESRAALAEEFGELDSASEVLPFDFTSYYDQEMGPNIQRQIVSVHALVDPEDLARIKHSANKMEADRADPSGHRPLNIDPGLLSLSRVILATTKSASHRIPIGDQMYAEITLLYQKGQYQILPWTYPDYATDAIRR